MTKDDWKPDWCIEERNPTFFEKTNPSQPDDSKVSWWGAMPALDLLKLDRNEGQDAPRRLRLLQTGEAHHKLTSMFIELISDCS
jgi:hypothetical protein